MHRERFLRHRGLADPNMHHGTCVTHVPWCMSGSLTSGFLWSWWQGKRSRHSRRMRNPQFYVSCKRPIVEVEESAVTYIQFLCITSVALMVKTKMHSIPVHDIQPWRLKTFDLQLIEHLKTFRNGNCFNIHSFQLMSLHTYKKRTTFTCLKYFIH